MPGNRYLLDTNALVALLQSNPELVELTQHAQITIGSVAGLRPEKNIARLIQAFAAVRARQT
jgi:predicted nucleic acid-binding protein